MDPATRRECTTSAVSTPGRPVGPSAGRPRTRRRVGLSTIPSGDPGATGGEGAGPSRGGRGATSGPGGPGPVGRDRVGRGGGGGRPTRSTYAVTSLFCLTQCTYVRVQCPRLLTNPFPPCFFSLRVVTVCR